MKRKKILFIWTDLTRGGAEKALLNLAAKLNKSYLARILLCYNNVEYANIDNSLSIKSITSYTSRLPKPFKHIKIFFIVLFSIFKSDIVIAYDIPLVTVITGISCRIFFWKKVVYWIHVCKAELTQTSSKFHDAMIKWTLAKASKCICVSETCRNSLIRYLGRERHNTQVISNIIDDYNSLCKESPKSFSAIKIAGLGRLTKEKRFDVLIESISLAYKQGLMLEVKIAGDGPEKERLQYLINYLSLNDVVKLIGPVSDPISFLKSSDIFISSSISEALPYNVIEALICRKPVIVTNTGAAEIVEYGKYGIVVEKNKPEALAEAICYLATNETKRQEFSEKAHFALEKFNTDKIVQQWINLIEND